MEVIDGFLLADDGPTFRVVLRDMNISTFGKRGTPADRDDYVGYREFSIAEETRRLLGVTEIRELPAGEAVFREGDAGSELYFLLHGRLSIYLTRDGTRGTRVVTFLPGNTFGDVAFIDGRPRTASAVCDVDCGVLLLSRAGLDRLALEAPEVVAHIYASLALDIAGRLRNTDMLLREELSP